jgi:hypothetical protein
MLKKISKLKLENDFIHLNSRTKLLQDSKYHYGTATKKTTFSKEYIIFPLSATQFKGI